MAAGKYNIVIDQGADFSMQLTVSIDGSAVDLTDYSVRAQMRTKASSANVAATFTCSVLGDPALGIIHVELLNDVTKLLEPGRYVYDIEVYTAADALVARVLKGSVTVDAEVTR